MNMNAHFIAALITAIATLILIFYGGFLFGCWFTENKK